MSRKGCLIQGWIVRCGETKCKEKVALDTTIAVAENTLKSLGWRNTISCGWVCKEHARSKL